MIFLSAVGLDERVDTVIEKLKMQDPSIRAIVLHGMGGTETFETFGVDRS